MPILGVRRQELELTEKRRKEEKEERGFFFADTLAGDAVEMLMLCFARQEKGTRLTLTAYCTAPRAAATHFAISHRWTVPRFSHFSGGHEVLEKDKPPIPSSSS